VRADTLEDMRRRTALMTSVLWFVLTSGLGAVIVPGWLTGWHARQPYPYSGMVRVLRVVLIVVGLIPRCMCSRSSSGPEGPRRRAP